MRLEDVTPGTQITGIVGATPVTVVAMMWIGGNALRLTYRTDSGKLDERLLYRDHEPRLELAKRGAAYDLSADGGSFKLAAEELMLRGDLERCLIVAPGGLVEQWQDELRDKFGLSFELLTRQLADAEPPAAEHTVFTKHHLLIARMDQLSRSDDLKGQLERSGWDLVVVDEAHRISAHYFGNELKKVPYARKTSTRQSCSRAA